jgi:hypothetical protein
MSSCYLCTIHDDPSARPDAVGQCGCGIFACIYDGARRHTVGEFECALCIVQVLLASAGVRLPGPDGGGGGGVAMLQAEVRKFLGTEDFEAQCKELQLATRTQRAEWRQRLMAGVTVGTMQTLGTKIGELTGRGPALGQALVDATSGGNTADFDLLADAAGVAQYAARVVGTPEHVLGLASMALPEVEQRGQTEGSVIGATVVEEKPEEKVKYMTMGGGTT